MGVIAVTATIAIMLAFLLAANDTRAKRGRVKDTLAAQARTDRVICERVNKLYRLIQAQVRLSLKQNPTLTYYKTHPDELVAVQQATRDEITAFAPKTCPKEG